MSEASISRRRLIVVSAISALSGLASGLAVALGLRSTADLWGYLVLYLPGALFALLVLLPLLKGVDMQVARGLIIMLVSMATHYAAVRASVAVVEKPLFLLFIAFVGGVAAAIVSFCSAFLLRIRVRALPTLMAVLSGGLAGLAIGTPFTAHAAFSDTMEIVLITSGYVIWQIGVAISLACEKDSPDT